MHVFATVPILRSRTMPDAPPFVPARLHRLPTPSAFNPANADIGVHDVGADIVEAQTRGALLLRH